LRIRQRLLETRSASCDDHLPGDRLAPGLPHDGEGEGRPLPPLAEVQRRAARGAEESGGRPLHEMAELLVSILPHFDEPAAVRFGEQLEVPSHRVHRGGLEIRPEVPAEGHLGRGHHEASVAQIVAGRDRSGAYRREQMIDGRAKRARTATRFRHTSSTAVAPPRKGSRDVTCGVEAVAMARARHESTRGLTTAASPWAAFPITPCKGLMTVDARTSWSY